MIRPRIRFLRSLRSDISSIYEFCIQKCSLCNVAVRYRASSAGWAVSVPRGHHNSSSNPQGCLGDICHVDVCVSPGTAPRSQLRHQSPAGMCWQHRLQQLWWLQLYSNSCLPQHSHHQCKVGPCISLAPHITSKRRPCSMLCRYVRLNSVSVFRCPTGQRRHEDKLDGYTFDFPDVWIPVTVRP